MHNSVLLHTAAVAEEVHLVRLLLVFFLHLILLCGEPSLHLLFLSNQTRPQILRLLFLGGEASPKFFRISFQLEVLLPSFTNLALQGFLFSFQNIRLSPDNLLFPLDPAQLL